MDKQLENLVPLNPIEPLEIADAVLIVSNGQILYQAPLPSDPNATEEWQRLCDGMRHAHYAFKYESWQARMNAPQEGGTDHEPVTSSESAG